MEEVAKLKGQLGGTIEKNQYKVQELERDKQTHKKEIEVLKWKVNTGLEQVARLGRQQKWQWKGLQHKMQEFERKKQSSRRHCRT